MRNLSKVLALVLSLAFVLTMFAGAAFIVPTGDKAVYTDADAFGAAGKEAVRILTALGIVKGYPEGDFKPAGDVTRAEFAKMVALAKTGKTVDNDADFNFYDTQIVLPFTDVADGDWFKGYVNYAYLNFVLAGYGDNTLRPKNNVTGVEAVKMVLVALGYDPKLEGLEGADWARNTMTLAGKTGLLKDLGNENMYAAFDREATAILIWNALNEKMVAYNNGYVYFTGKTLGDVAFGGIEIAKAVDKDNVKLAADGEYYIDGVKVSYEDAKAALEDAKKSSAPVEEKNGAIYFYSYDVYKVKAVDGDKLTLWGKGDVTVVDAADIAAGDFIVLWANTLGNKKVNFAKELDVVTGKVTAYTINSKDGDGLGTTIPGGKYTINGKQYEFGSLADEFDNEAKGLKDESDYFAQLLGKGSAAVNDAELTFIVDGNYIVAVFVNENTYWENYAIVIGYNPVDNTLGMQHIRLLTDDNEYKDMYVASINGEQIYNTLLHTNGVSSSLLNGTNLPALNTLVRYEDLGNNKIALYTVDYANAVSDVLTTADDGIEMTFDAFTGNWKGYNIGAENKPQKETTFNWENGVVFVSYKSVLNLEQYQDLINELAEEMTMGMFGGDLKFAADEFTALAPAYNLQGLVSDLRDFGLAYAEYMMLDDEDKENVEAPVLLGFDMDKLEEEFNEVAMEAIKEELVKRGMDKRELDAMSEGDLAVLLEDEFEEGEKEEFLFPLQIEFFKNIIVELLGNYVAYQWRAYRYGEFQPDARENISNNRALFDDATVVCANSLNNSITLKAAAIEFTASGEYLPGLPLRANQIWGTVTSVTDIGMTTEDGAKKYAYKFNILNPWDTTSSAITVYADYKLQTVTMGDIYKLYVDEDGICRRFEIAKTAQKDLGKTNNYLEIGYWNITNAYWSPADNGWYLTLKHPYIDDGFAVESDTYFLPAESDAYFVEGLFGTGIKALDYVKEIGAYGIASLINDKSWEVFADINPTTKTIGSIWFNKNAGSEPATFKFDTTIDVYYDDGAEKVTYTINGYDNITFANGTKKWTVEAKPYELLAPIGKAVNATLTATLAENGGWYVTAIGGYTWIAYGEADTGVVGAQFDTWSSDPATYTLNTPANATTKTIVYSIADTTDLVWYRENFALTNVLYTASADDIAGTPLAEKDEAITDLEDLDFDMDQNDWDNEWAAYDYEIVYVMVGADATAAEMIVPVDFDTTDAGVNNGSAAVEYFPYVAGTGSYFE